MAAAEPNEVPSACLSLPVRISGKFTTLVAISDHLRGSECPMWVRRSQVVIARDAVRVIDEPWQAAIERDRATVMDKRRPDPDDRASQYAAANSGVRTLGFQVQLHGSARQQPVTGFDQGSGGRHIDKMCAMARAHPRRHDAMLFNPVQPLRRSSVDRQRHSALHRLVRRSNFSNRAFPVSPKMRTAYC